MLKNKIQINFDRAAIDYENAAIIQQKSANHLIQCLDKHSHNLTPQKILDIGAGTGIVTKLLMQKFPAAQYILNDLSPLMLEVAKSKLHKYTNINYILGDAENTIFQPVDLIVSNLCFQWFADLNKSINQLWQNTKVLAFSTLSSKTFEQWNKLYQRLEIDNYKLHDYPTSKTLKTYCLNLKPRRYSFYNKTYQLVFDDALSFLKYLKKLGANTPIAKLRNDHLSFIIKSQPNPFAISYKIFFAILMK